MSDKQASPFLWLVNETVGVASWTLWAAEKLAQEKQQKENDDGN